MTQGLLFDLDGTLIDSMPLHHDAWRLWFAQAGLAFDEATFFERTAGRTNAEILADLFPHHSPAENELLAEQKEALYRSAAAERLTLIDGALAFMEKAHDRGLALAICTAAPLGNIAVAFERFGLQALVQTVTSPADGLRGKPHPDIFLEAARRLNLQPNQCIVFEDAPLGIEAARRAAMRAVALTTTVDAVAFGDAPHVIATARDFTSLDLNTLLESSHA